MKDQFSLKRLSLLITREFALNKKNIFLMIASMTFVSILVTYLLPLKIYMNGAEWKNYRIYPPVVMIYGIVVSAYSFIELNFSDRNVEFIMLPSSTLEKYLTKFIYSTFGYLLMGVFALSVTSIFVRILNVDTLPGYKWEIPFIEIFNYITLVQIYLMFHSIFFFGGVYFRKLELVKTFLAAVGLFAVFYIYSITLGEVLGFQKISPHLNIGNYNYFDFKNDSEKFLTLVSRRKLLELFFNTWNTLVLIGFYILPLFFWIVSYLRLKENEVTDGV